MAGSKDRFVDECPFSKTGWAWWKTTGGCTCVPAKEPKMIGSCDNCSRYNVPVSKGFACGMETVQCFLCQGDDDPDPYGELDDLTEEQHAKRIRDALLRMPGA